jgi:hypothetical protein
MNLGMALSQTQYKDYASLAFDESLKVEPGDKVVAFNYLFILL